MEIAIMGIAITVFGKLIENNKFECLKKLSQNSIMQKRSRTKYWLTCAVLALFSFSAQGFEYTVEHLLEEGNISKECLRMLVYQGGCSREDLESFKGDECESEGCITEWEYIGSIGKYHVIYTLLQGETWWIGSLNVVKFLENRIIKTSCLDGAKRSEIVGGAKIQGGCILYSQMTNGTSFFEYVTETNSELKALHPERDEVSWFGTFNWKCQLDDEGNMHSDKIVGFTPCAGMLSGTVSTYPVEDFKKLFLQIFNSRARTEVK